MSPPPTKRLREEPPEEDEEDKQVAMVCVIPNKAHSLLYKYTFPLLLDHEDSEDSD